MTNLDLEIQILDDQRQMRNLVNAVKLSDSFSLLFVRCNQRSRQKEIIAELQANLDGCKIKVIFLENQIEHLLDELQKRLGDEKPDAVFVYGLESSFPKADKAAESPFVVTLNHSRNSFKNVLDCPLVLFLPEYALSAIYHGATDFYSIRSGVYLFSAKAEETNWQISQHIGFDYRELSGLLHEERQNSIKTIENLLAEYQSLPDLQRDINKEQLVKNKLADLYKVSAQYDKAEDLYLKNIEYFLESDNLILLASSLNDLGLIYTEQEKYDEAIRLYKQSLQIHKETFGINNSNYASVLNNLATAYAYQNKNDEAIELLEEALQITKEKLGTNNPEYAGNISNIASIYRTQGRYAEAIQLYEESLPIIKATLGTNYPEYARQLSNLAGIYFEQAKYRKALLLLKESYQIYCKVFGKNHPDTINIKQGIELNKIAMKEQASLIVPYKK